MKDVNNYLKLIFSPKWELIEGVREFLEDFAFTSIKNSSLAKATALTASELLENAVKFSAGERVQLEVDLFRSAEKEEGICVTVENFAHLTNIQKLQSTLKEITQISPREAYLARLKIAMERGMRSTISELGLARIQYEAYAHCSLQIRDNNYVSLSAKIMKNSI
ncbi:MAG: hypothetical protein JXJ04_15655 [Spirochaetales bacterium]|nr:hypothetical protein [Spirochaetales bacterium]